MGEHCSHCGSTRRLSREDEVLLKVARNSSDYRSAILSALDLPVARDLRAAGFLVSPLDGWFNLTDAGSRRAQEIARRA